MIGNHPLFVMRFKFFRALRRPRLRSVLWLARHPDRDAALAKNLPHRSREKRVHPRTGFSAKDRYVLDGFGRVERVGSGSKLLPCSGRRVKTGCAMLAHEFGRVSRQRLAPFTPFGVSSSPPIPPSSGHPSVAKRPKTSAADGRASRRGLSSRYSETRPRSLIRPQNS